MGIRDLFLLGNKKDAVNRISIYITWRLTFFKDV